MTREEAKAKLEAYIMCEIKKSHFDCSDSKCDDNCPLLYEMGTVGEHNEAINIAIKALKQEPNIGHCKECKYFEYDSVARVDGIPIIVAHEICKKWGNGCKTKEDGYCFLFEPNESEEEV